MSERDDYDEERAEGYRARKAYDRYFRELGDPSGPPPVHPDDQELAGDFLEQDAARVYDELDLPPENRRSQEDLSYLRWTAAVNHLLKQGKIRYGSNGFLEQV